MDQEPFHDDGMTIVNQFKAIVIDADDMSPGGVLNPSRTLTTNDIVIYQRDISSKDTNCPGKYQLGYRDMYLDVSASIHLDIDDIDSDMCQSVGLTDPLDQWAVSSESYQRLVIRLSYNQQVRNVENMSSKSRNDMDADQASVLAWYIYFTDCDSFDSFLAAVRDVLAETIFHDICHTNIIIIHPSETTSPRQPRKSLDQQTIAPQIFGSPSDEPARQESELVSLILLSKLQDGLEKLSSIVDDSHTIYQRMKRILECKIQVCDALNKMMDDPRSVTREEIHEILATTTQDEVRVVYVHSSLGLRSH